MHSLTNNHRKVSKKSEMLSQPSIRFTKLKESDDTKLGESTKKTSHQL